MLYGLHDFRINCGPGKRNSIAGQHMTSDRLDVSQIRILNRGYAFEQADLGAQQRAHLFLNDSWVRQAC